jgi:hypothetical protein
MPCPMETRKTLMNERKAVIIGLIGIFSFEFITLIFVLFKYSWQTMYLMQWAGFFGSIAYSIYQFKWIDKITKKR